MSARDDLRSDLLHNKAALALPYPGLWADARIDRYRNEVLREAADAVALDRDATLPSGGRGAWRRGMTHAIDLLRHMADGNAGPVEKAGAPAPTATPQPDFFQPEHGYNHRSYGCDFLCVAVTTHPVTGERLAVGWLSEDGDWHRPTVVGINQWNHEYDGVEPPASTPEPTEKASEDGPPATPQPERSGEWAPAAALRDRLADLLAHIRKHPGRTWTTEDVRKFYLSQAPKRATCRRDLTALRAMGWLTEHDEPGRRFFTLNTRKDGQR
ncbi:hypothetical protein ACFWM0_14790 [Streptomyces sp. NPDC058405]|uniref:hypothetical protein n=1 Tax=Streptomyces sp. NPDC058405 TaxID=3346482 RepID=UPI00365EF956